MKKLILGVIVFLTASLIAYYFFNKRQAGKTGLNFSCGVSAEQVNRRDNQGFMADCSLAWNIPLLKIQFISRDNFPKSLQERIINIAAEWEGHSGLIFKLIDQNDAVTPTQIRIQTKFTGGNWSRIGVSAQDTYTKPTMKLHDIENLFKEKPNKARAIILHEFGHAIGFLHELQNPNNPIVWDSTKAYAYFKKHHGMEPPDVDRNVFKTPEHTDASEFDPLSIMNYPVPVEITKNNYHIDLISELSEIDKKGLENCKPSS